LNVQYTGCDEALQKSTDKPEAVIACKQGIPCRQGRDPGVNIYSNLPAEDF